MTHGGWQREVRSWGVVPGGVPLRCDDEREDREEDEREDRRGDRDDDDRTRYRGDRDEAGRDRDEGERERGGLMGRIGDLLGGNDRGRE